MSAGHPPPSRRALSNQRMQLAGRGAAQAPVHISFHVAAVEALVCVRRAFTARS
jgi:hypothetical protein